MPEIIGRALADVLRRPIAAVLLLGVVPSAWAYVVLLLAEAIAGAWSGGPFSGAVQVTIAAASATLWAAMLTVQFSVGLAMARGSPIRVAAVVDGLFSGTSLIGVTIALAVLAKLIASIPHTPSSPGLGTVARLVGTSVVTYAACRLVTFGPLVVETQLTFAQALLSAMAHTRNHMMRVFGLLLCVGLPTLAVTLLLQTHPIARLVVLTLFSPIAVLAAVHVYLVSTNLGGSGTSGRADSIGSGKLTKMPT